MLDFIGTVAVTATMIVCINSVISSMAVTPLPRLLLALLAGLWIGLAVALGTSGEFADAGRRPVPLIGIMFATPLLGTAIAAWLSLRVRQALLSVPLPLLVGLNVPRLIGAAFLVLAAQGRLSGPFHIAAAWGDVITALVAVPIAWRIAQPEGTSHWATDLWNLFGALDLLVAVVLGAVSTPGSAIQLIATSVGPAAMQQLPWALIPTVLVPFWLIGHGIIFARLRAGAYKLRTI